MHKDNVGKAHIKFSFNNSEDPSGDLQHWIPIRLVRHWFNHNSVRDRTQKRCVDISIHVQNDADDALYGPLLSTPPLPHRYFILKNPLIPV